MQGSKYKNKLNLSLKAVFQSKTKNPESFFINFKDLLYNILKIYML